MMRMSLQPLGHLHQGDAYYGCTCSAKCCFPVIVNSVRPGCWAPASSHASAQTRAPLG